MLSTFTADAKMIIALPQVEELRHLMPTQRRLRKKGAAANDILKSSPRL